jgi:hypothetical protein
MKKCVDTFWCEFHIARKIAWLGRVGDGCQFDVIERNLVVLRVRRLCRPLPNVREGMQQNESISLAMRPIGGDIIITTINLFWRKATIIRRSQLLMEIE